MNILEKICHQKIIDVTKKKTKIDYEKKIKIQKRRKFLDKLLINNKDKFNLIAEIKRASPSRGEICKKFELNEIALDYAEAGASCLSILTEENFFFRKA